MFFKRRPKTRPSNPGAAREWDNAVLPPSLRHGCAAPAFDPEAEAFFEEPAISEEDLDDAEDPSVEF